MALALEQVAPRARKPVGGFVERVAGRLGQRLQAAVVFGEAASPAFMPGRHPIRTLLLVEVVDAPALSVVGEAMQEARSQGVAAPLMFTSAELSRSLDAFPIELSEVKRTGTTVLGEFVPAELVIRPEHLRLQCERELRGLVVHARLAWFAAAGSARELGRLLAAGSGRLLPVLEASAGLLAAAEVAGPAAVAQRLGSLLGVDATVLVDLFALADAQVPLFARERLPELALLLDRLVERVDAWQPGGQ
jgi:hypothetical protein